MGGIHKAERPSKSQPAKQCGFTPVKPSRMFSTRRRVRLARNLLRQRDRQCGSKAAATVAAAREGSENERDVQRSPARAARAKLVTQAAAAACGDERKNLPSRTNRQQPAWQGVVRCLCYGSRRPPLDVPSVGTLFRARRIVRTDRRRPGQRRPPGIRTDRSREREAIRSGELSEY